MVLGDGRRLLKCAGNDTVVGKELRPIRSADRSGTICRSGVRTGVLVNHSVAGLRGGRRDDDLGRTAVQRFGIIADQRDGRLHQLLVTVVRNGEAAPRDRRAVQRRDGSVGNCREFIVGCVVPAQHKGHALAGADVTAVKGRGGDDVVFRDHVVRGGDRDHLRRRAIVRLGQGGSKGQSSGRDGPLLGGGLNGNFIVVVGADNAGDVVACEGARFIGIGKGNGGAVASQAVRLVGKRVLRAVSDGQDVVLLVVDNAGEVGRGIDAVGPHPAYVDRLLRDDDIEVHKVADGISGAFILAIDQDVSTVIIHVSAVFVLNVNRTPIIVACKRAVVVALAGDDCPMRAGVRLRKGDRAAGGGAVVLHAAGDKPPAESQFFVADKALDGSDLALRRGKVSTGPVGGVVPSDGQGRRRDGKRLRHVRIGEVIVGIVFGIDDRNVLARIQEVRFGIVLLKVDRFGQINSAVRRGARKVCAHRGAAVCAVVNVAIKAPSDLGHREGRDGQGPLLTDKGLEVVVRNDRHDVIGAGVHDAVRHIRPTAEVCKVEGQVGVGGVVISRRQRGRVVAGSGRARRSVKGIRGSLDRIRRDRRISNAACHSRVDKVQIPRRTAVGIATVVQEQLAVGARRIVEVSRINDPVLAVIRAGRERVVIRCIDAYGEADDLRGLCRDNVVHAVDIRRIVAVTIGGGVVNSRRRFGSEDRRVRRQSGVDALRSHIISELRDCRRRGDLYAVIRIALPSDRNFNRRDRKSRGQCGLSGQSDVVVARADRRGDQPTGDHAANEEHVLRAVLAVVAVHDGRSSSVFTADRIGHGDGFVVLRHSGRDGDQMRITVVLNGQIRKGQTGDRRLVDGQGNCGEGVVRQQIVGVFNTDDADRIDTGVGRAVAGYRHAAVRGDRVGEAQGLRALTKVGRTGHHNGVRLRVIGVFAACKGQAGDRPLVDDPFLRVVAIQDVVLGQIAVQAHTRRGRGGGARDRVAAAVHQHVHCRSILVIDGDGSDVAGRRDSIIVFVEVGEVVGVELHALRLVVVGELCDAVCDGQSTVGEIRPSGVDLDRRDHKGLGIATRQVVVCRKVSAVVRKRDRHCVGVHILCGKLVDLRAGASRKVGISGVEIQGFTGDDAIQAKREADEGSGIVHTVVSIRRYGIADGKRHVFTGDIVFARAGQGFVIGARRNHRFGVILAGVLDVFTRDRHGTRAVGIEGVDHGDLIIVLRQTFFVTVFDGDVRSVAVGVVFAGAVRQGDVCDGRLVDEEDQVVSVSVHDQRRIVVVGAGGKIHLAIVSTRIGRIDNRGKPRRIGVIGKGCGERVVVTSQTFAVGTANGKRLHRLVIGGGHVVGVDIAIVYDICFRDREGSLPLGEIIVVIIHGAKDDAVRRNAAAHDPDVNGRVSRAVCGRSEGSKTIRLRIGRVGEVDGVAIDNVAYRHGDTVRPLIIRHATAHRAERIAARRVIGDPTEGQSAFCNAESSGLGRIKLVVCRIGARKRDSHAVFAVSAKDVCAHARRHNVARIELAVTGRRRAACKGRRHRPVVAVVGGGPSDAVAVDVAQTGVLITVRHRPSHGQDLAIDREDRGQDLIVIVATRGNDNQDPVGACVGHRRKEIIASHLGISVVSDHSAIAEHICAGCGFNVLRISNGRRRTARIFNRIVLGISGRVAIRNVQRMRRSIISKGVAAEREVCEVCLDDLIINDFGVRRHIVVAGKRCINAVTADVDTRIGAQCSDQCVARIRAVILFFFRIGEEVDAIIGYERTVLIQSILVIHVIDRIIYLIVKSSGRAVEGCRTRFAVVPDDRIDLDHNIIGTVVDRHRIDGPEVITHTVCQFIVHAACAVDQDGFDVSGITGNFAICPVDVSCAVAGIGKGNDFPFYIGFIRNRKNGVRLTVEVTLGSAPTIALRRPSIGNLDRIDVEGTSCQLRVDRIVVTAGSESHRRSIGIGVQRRVVEGNAADRHDIIVDHAADGRRRRPSVAVIRRAEGAGVLLRGRTGCAVADEPSNRQLLLVDHKGLKKGREGVIIVDKIGAGARSDRADRNTVSGSVHAGEVKGLADRHRGGDRAAVYQQTGDGGRRREGIGKGQELARDQATDLKGSALGFFVVFVRGRAADRKGQDLLRNRPSCGALRNVVVIVQSVSGPLIFAFDQNVLARFVLVGAVFVFKVIRVHPNVVARDASGEGAVQHCGVGAVGRPGCGEGDHVVRDVHRSIGADRRSRKGQFITALDAFDRKDPALRLAAVHAGVIDGIAMDDAETSRGDRNASRRIFVAEHQRVVVVACGDDDLHVVSADVHRSCKIADLGGISGVAVVMRVGYRNFGAVRNASAVVGICVVYDQDVRRAVIDHRVRRADRDAGDDRPVDDPSLGIIGDGVVAALGTGERRRSRVVAGVDRGVIRKNQINVGCVDRIHLAEVRIARRTRLIDGSDDRLGLVGIGEGRIDPSDRNRLRRDDPGLRFGSDGVVAAGDRSDSYGVGAGIRRGKRHALFIFVPGRGRGGKVGRRDVGAGKRNGHRLIRDDVLYL